jgi:chemotaxis protein histidine kinase CheA
MVGDTAFQMMQYLDEIRAGRIGVSADGTASPENIGNAIGSQGVDRMMSAKEELCGLIIRVICETGIKPLCVKIRDLVTKHVDSIQDFQFKGQWTKVDPSKWPTRTKSTVRVGTGTGDTRAKLMAIQQVQQLQAQIFQMPGQALVNQNKAYAAINDFCKFSGLQGAEKYFIDPSSPEGQQSTQQAQQAQQAQEQQMQQAHLQQMQLEAQLAQAATTTAQAQMANVQLKGEVEGMKHQRDLEKHAFEAQVANLMAELETAKAAEKSHKEIADLQFKYDELQSKEALEYKKLDEARLAKEQDNVVKLEIERMKLEEVEPAGEIEETTKPIDEMKPLIEAIQEMSRMQLEHNANIVTALSKPKKLIRGEDGRAMGIE